MQTTMGKLIALKVLFAVIAITVADGISVQNAGRKDERKTKEKGVCDVYRQATGGAPIPSYTVSRTCGKDGPLVVEDITYFKLLAGYERERTPGRTVHGKGAGAFGYFEVTHDITEYTKAAVFSRVGLKTPLNCRFSPGSGLTGIPDSLRSRYGVACKFYTTEGNWDIVGQMNPVFYVRDPILYPSFIHSEGPNPVTGRPDANMTWDFFTKRQESLNALLYLYSDQGTPYSYRHTNGYGVHAYVFVNKENHPTYVKFTWTTDQGIKNFTEDESKKKSGEDKDWYLKDLYDNIAAGNHPSWTLWIQVMSFEQAQQVNFNPLDSTVLWPERDFPFKPVGKMVLNKNPTSYFSDVDQAGYSVTNLVSGIEYSTDRLLQGRLFAYDDAQRYRLGMNSHLLKVNSPQGVPCPVHTINRDGFMNGDNQDGQPNYYPNTFSNLHPDKSAEFRSYNISGTVDRHDLGNRANYKQARAIFNTFSETDQDHIAYNIGSEIKNIMKSLQCRVLEFMGGVSMDFAANIARYGNVESCPGHMVQT